MTNNESQGARMKSTDPYRPEPEDAGKRFCKQCSHFCGFRDGAYRCSDNYRLDPVRGRIVELLRCHDRNKDFDCSGFTQKPIDEGVWHVPKLAFWLTSACVTVGAIGAVLWGLTS